MSTPIVMPKAGLTMVEGTIVSWIAKEGSTVAKGDPVMEYENEKNTIECTALEDGILHIVAQEGDTVAVGTKIAILAKDQAEYASLASGTAPMAAPAASASTAMAAEAEGVVEIPMPKAGLTMVEGTIGTWLVQEGDYVEKGAVVMEFENEKNTIEYEIIHGGFIHMIAREGDTVEVGKTIAYVADTKENYDRVAASGVPTGAASAVPAAAPAAPPAAARPAAVRTGRVRATGLAKKMAREAGVDLTLVSPSGGKDGSRIVARDITAYLASGAEAAAPAAASAALEDEVEEVTWAGVRGAIARNMMNSLHNSAQCTSVIEADVTKLLALRKCLVERQDFIGCKITVNDLLCMAMTKVLVKHPLINATFDGKTLCKHKHVHLSVAVATEGGLMVPVVKFADTLTLVEMSRAIKDLGIRAREKRLVSGEQGCGTFTVSNVGMFPTLFANPIINAPEVGIMGFGKTTKKPVYVEGQFVPRDMMYAYLTFDHRVIDGLEVGRIQQDLLTLLENPELITV